MRILLISLVIACSLLSGCAVNQPRLSRAEWLTLTAHHYDGVSVDKSLEAAEKLFILADGDDFKFSYVENSLYASRRWSVYLVLTAALGTDTWLVHAEKDGNGVNLSVQVASQSGGVVPTPTAHGDIAVTGTPSLGGEPVQGSAIYDVFWARMDYLLGKTSHWMTCQEADQRVKQKITWGDNGALCNSFNVKDAAPEEVTSHGVSNG